jgi:DNA replication protein DnaC
MLQTAVPAPVEPPHRPMPDLLPHHLRGWTFDRLDPWRAPLAYHVCREYATHGEYQGQKCLLLTGQVGIGKSSLAAAILHQTIAQTQDPHYARFWPLRDGFRVIAQSLSLPPDQHLYLSALLAHPLLIVDDLGWPASDWEANQLYLLFETLWAEERPAVFVTDLGPAALQEALVYAQVWPFLTMCHRVEAWEPGTPPRW